MSIDHNHNHPSPGSIFFNTKKSKNNNNRSSSYLSSPPVFNDDNRNRFNTIDTPPERQALPKNPFSCLEALRALDKNINTRTSSETQNQSTSSDHSSCSLNRYVVRHPISREPQPKKNQTYPATNQICFEDEQLSWKGSTLIWSRGTTIYKKFDYSQASPNRSSQSDLPGHRTFSSTKYIQQALFATFDSPDSKPLSNPVAPCLDGPLDAHFSIDDELSDSASTTAKNKASASNHQLSACCPESPDHFEPWSDNRSTKRTRWTSPKATVRGLCVLLSDTLRIYLETGEEYSLAIPFPIQKIWPIERGLIIMRKPTAVRPRTFVSPNARNTSQSLFQPPPKAKNQSKRAVTNLGGGGLIPSEVHWPPQPIAQSESLMFDSMVTENEPTRLWSSLAGFDLDDRRAMEEDNFFKTDDGDYSAELARYWAERRQIESSMLWTLSDPCTHYFQPVLTTEKIILSGGSSKHSNSDPYLTTKGSQNPSDLFCKAIAPLTPLVTPPRNLGCSLATGTVVFVSDPKIDPLYPICVTASTEGFTIFFYGRLPPNSSHTSSGIIPASQAPPPPTSPQASFTARSPTPPPPPPPPPSSQLPQLRRSPRKLPSSSVNNKNFDHPKNESANLSPTYSRQSIGRLGGLGHPSIRRNSISINKKRGANSTNNLSGHTSTNRRLSIVSNSSNNSFTFGSSNPLMKSTNGGNNNQRSLVEHQLEMMSNGLNQSQNGRTGKLNINNHREVKSTGFDEWFDGITDFSHMIGTGYKKNDEDDEAHLADEALEPEFVIQTLETVEVSGRLLPEELPSIHAAIYDSRGSTAYLAICVPSKSKVYIFQMIRSSTSIILRSIGKPLEGTSIGPVLCSRPNVYDLFKFSNSTGQIEVFSADSILIHKFSHPDQTQSNERNVKAFIGSFVEIFTSDSSFSSPLRTNQFRKNCKIWADDLLSNLIFEAVSEEVGNQHLINIFQRFYQKISSHNDYQSKGIGSKALIDQTLETVFREALTGEASMDLNERRTKNSKNNRAGLEDENESGGKKNEDGDGDDRVFEEIVGEAEFDPLLNRLRSIKNLKNKRFKRENERLMAEEQLLAAKPTRSAPGSPRKRGSRQGSSGNLGSKSNQSISIESKKRMMIGLGKLFCDLRCCNSTLKEYFRLGELLIKLCESLGWIDWIDQLKRSILIIDSNPTRSIKKQFDSFNLSNNNNRFGGGGFSKIEEPLMPNLNDHLDRTFLNPRLNSPQKIYFDGEDGDEDEGGEGGENVQRDRSIKRVGFFGSKPFHQSYRRSRKVSRLYRTVSDQLSSESFSNNGYGYDRSSNRFHDEKVLNLIDKKFGWDEEDLNDLNLIDLLIIVKESLKSCRESIDRIDHQSQSNNKNDQLSIRFYELIGRNDLSSILIDRFKSQSMNNHNGKNGDAFGDSKTFKNRIPILSKKTFHVTTLPPPSISQLSSSSSSIFSIENQTLIETSNINDDLNKINNHLSSNNNYSSLKESPTGISVAARFSDDMRIIDVAKILNYCQEVRVRVKESVAEMPAIEIARQYASFFTGIAKRTMSLPLGGACFWYKTDPNIAANVPMIELDLRLLPTNVIIHPDPTKIEPLSWPRFHAGVAAGLSLSVDPKDFDSSQISLGRPDELDDRHAGYLLGLGLNRHLRSINRVQIFRYLESKHDMTSIGVLLGLSAAFIGTGDSRVSSIIAAHVPAMHPTESIQLQVNPLIQSAGFIGFGILHLGTGNRRISDGMLRELGKTWRVLTDTPDSCRESYTLSAGLGYGLVMLGKGTESDTPAHKDLMRTFKSLIHGDGAHPLPGLNQPTTTIDVSVTSPAATLALALLYLKTGKTEAAELCEIPQTKTRLEYVRPDLLMLRTLAKCLIMWNEIRAEFEWIERFVPKLIMEKVKGVSTISSAKDGQFGPKKKVKREVEMIYWSVISGSSLALALKYAGSASGAVHSILLKLYDQLLKITLRPVLSVQDKVRRHCSRCCHNVITLCLAIVMAGTGDLEVLRRLRVAHANVHDSIGYGTHLVTHQALGLLFLGGGRYTLGSSNRAIGSLVCAMYPIFPCRTDDQVYHLQALRHLWALAVEPRCLVARDVDRKDELIFLPIKLKIEEEESEQQLNEDGVGGGVESQLKTKLLTAPTLIPELQTIRSIRVESPRYWPLTIDLSKGSIQGESFRKTLTIFVKRRVGQLSYSQDPKGTKSIFSRGRTAEEITGSQIDDFGKRLNDVKESMKKNYFDDQMMGFEGEGGKGEGEDHIERLIEGFDLDEQSIGLINYLCNNYDHRNKDGKSYRKIGDEGLKGSGEGESEGGWGNDLSSFTSISLLQCLFEDKLEIFSIYLKLYLTFSEKFGKTSKSDKFNERRRGVDCGGKKMVLLDRPLEVQRLIKFYERREELYRQRYSEEEEDDDDDLMDEDDDDQEVKKKDSSRRDKNRLKKLQANEDVEKRRLLVDLNLLKQIELNQKNRIENGLSSMNDNDNVIGSKGEGLVGLVRKYVETDGKVLLDHRIGDESDHRILLEFLIRYKFPNPRQIKKLKETILILKSNLIRQENNKSKSNEGYDDAESRINLKLKSLIKGLIYHNLNNKFHNKVSENNTLNQSDGNKRVGIVVDGGSSSNDDSGVFREDVERRVVFGDENFLRFIFFFFL